MKRLRRREWNPGESEKYISVAEMQVDIGSIEKLGCGGKRVPHYVHTL